MQKFFLIALLPMLLLAGNTGACQTVYDTIMGRMRTDVNAPLGTAALNQNVLTFKNSLGVSGAWPDVSYTNPDIAHLYRVRILATGYTRNDCAYKNDTSVYNRIVLALQYWYNLNPTNSNWWYNDISYPQQIGQALILMRYGANQLPAPMESNLVTRMKKAGPILSGDGANTSDMALHYLYRACLTENTATLDSAVNYSFEGITYNFSEGLNQDNSFTAHGRQLYIGGYGNVFLSNSFNVAAYVAGTAYALTGPKLSQLVLFYKETYLKAGRNGYRDFNINGREISRGSGAAHSRAIGISNSFLEDARTVHPALGSTWDSVASGVHQKQPRHNHYWWADYDLHTRPGYTFNLRTISNRTIRTEKGNGENLLGKFLPDGATNIQRIGGEYQNIFPIWEWDKIPGTTSRDFSSDAGSVMSINWGEAGAGSFTGGVSDSLYGASVYNMNYNNVTAKKAWFFFDNEIVCLGAGITSSQAEPVITTVNQSWLYNDISVSNAATISSRDSNTNNSVAYATPQWLLHDSIGYFFPSGGSLNVSNITQSGSWYRINTTQSNTALTGKVFKAWFNHGISPTNAKYAYTVVPGLGTVGNMQAYDSSVIRIIKNSDSVQAVRHLSLDIMQVVFYKAGTITDSTISVSVNRPCVVMLKNLHSPQVAFSIADPAGQSSSVIVSAQLPNVTGGTKQLLASLPQGNYAGSTAFYIIDSSTYYTSPDSVLPIADAYVRDGSYAATNYGTATSLTVKQDGAGYNRQAYFKFDLRNIRRPVAKATFTLYSSGGNSTANTTQWALYKSANASWSETGITWANKPATSGLLATTQGQTAAGYVTWDITSEVNNMSGDSMLSLQLVSTVAGSSTDVSFYSKETSNSSLRPSIVFENIIPSSSLADSLTIIADAYVNNGSSAGTNYGYNSYLVSTNGSSGYLRQAYLKFDAHGIEGNITSAKLRLYNQGAVNTQVNVHNVPSNSWTEGSITWNNKPAADSVQALDSISGSIPVGYIYLDITSQLQNLGSDSILSLKVMAPENAPYAYTSFASKQSSTAEWRPQIKYTADTGTNGQVQLMLARLTAVKAIPALQPSVFKIYPNPAHQYINVAHTSAEPGAYINIQSIDGRGMFRKAVLAGATITSIVTANLKGGVYIVSFCNKGQRYNHKLLVQ